MPLIPPNDCNCFRLYEIFIFPSNCSKHGWKKWQTINSNKEKCIFTCTNFHLIVYSRFSFPVFLKCFSRSLSYKLSKKSWQHWNLQSDFWQKLHHDIPFLLSFCIRYSVRTTSALGLNGTVTLEICSFKANILAPPNLKPAVCESKVSSMLFTEKQFVLGWVYNTNVFHASS